MDQHMQAATVLYLRLSTKKWANSMEIEKSSYKWLIKQLFHGHCIVSQSLLNI